jgi:hypothetical protein
MSTTTPTSSTGPSPEDPSKRISEEFCKWDRLTRKNQKKRIGFGFVTALLGPIAVLLLTLQILVFPAPTRGEGSGVPPDCQPPMRWEASVLIGSELILLAGTLLISFCQIGRFRHKWIEYRVRTEVLRREQFLLQARVGPYLTTHNPANAVHRRLEVIRNRQDPMELIPLQYPEGKTWRDELEDDGPGTPPQPNLLECLRTYLANRLDDQLKWFSNRETSHAKHDWWLETGAKVLLLLAVLAALVHLALVLDLVKLPRASQDPAGDSVLRAIIGFVFTVLFPPAGLGFYTLGWLHNLHHLHLAVGLAAIVYPPASAALTALQSLFESKRLSRSYHGHTVVLTGLVEECMKLQDEIETVIPTSKDLDRNSLTERQKTDQEKRLKRLILRTEELLASELRHWWLVVSGGGDFL